ncbi:MAG: aspartyl protease family protein [Candidatus Aminicenantes bacterium]|nr:aspartyl protease family protein [Candidatus Aminicenantes bacterium]
MNKILCSILTLALSGFGLAVQDPAPAGAKLLSLIKSDSFREADRLASTLLKNPDIDPATSSLCGLAVLKAGRIEEAERILKTAVELAPGNPEVHLGLGRLARIRNDNDAAIPHLEKAVFSASLHEEALRHLVRAVKERGRTDDLRRIRTLAGERYRRDGQSLPSWLEDAFIQVQDRKGKQLYRMEGRFESLSLPLVLRDNNAQFGLRMVSLKINGKKEYPFDIDSALADFLTVSPQLAEELGLSLTGNATATGVGTREARVRFAVLDKVEIGPVAFYDVPVRVADIQSFRGRRKGLLGTGLLKRFNVTIDSVKEKMILYPLDRPDLLAADIDRKAVAADIPLYIFDQTVVAASVGGTPEALYILDSAAATNLSDKPFFAAHIRPKLEPGRIVQAGIQGAGGPQQTLRVDGVSISLGPLAFPAQTIHEFDMSALNKIAGRYTAGLLGNPLLWPYRVHLDFKAGRLILEKR